MRSYEIEQALSRKVDDWKFNCLESEVRQMKQQNEMLREKLLHFANKADNLEYVLQEVLRFFRESENEEYDYIKHLQL